MVQGSLVSMSMGKPATRCAEPHTRIISHTTRTAGGVPRLVCAGRLCMAVVPGHAHLLLILQTRLSSPAPLNPAAHKTRVSRMPAGHTLAATVAPPQPAGRHTAAPAQRAELKPGTPPISVNTNSCAHASPRCLRPCAPANSEPSVRQARRTAACWHTQQNSRPPPPPPPAHTHAHTKPSPPQRLLACCSRRRL
jgi:hypothetical protein